MEHVTDRFGDRVRTKTNVMSTNSKSVNLFIFTLVVGIGFIVTVYSIAAALWNISPRGMAQHL